MHRAPTAHIHHQRNSIHTLIEVTRDARIASVRHITLLLIFFAPVGEARTAAGEAKKSVVLILNLLPQGILV